MHMQCNAMQCASAQNRVYCTLRLPKQDTPSPPVMSRPPAGLSTRHLHHGNPCLSYAVSMYFLFSSSLSVSLPSLASLNTITTHYTYLHSYRTRYSAFLGQPQKKKRWNVINYGLGSCGHLLYIFVELILFSRQLCSSEDKEPGVDQFNILHIISPETGRMRTISDLSTWVLNRPSDLHHIISFHPGSQLSDVPTLGW